MDVASESLHWCRTVVVLDNVVVVVDSLELELDEEYPDGETGGGVRLRDDPGRGDPGDGIRSISSLRLSFVPLMCRNCSMVFLRVRWRSLENPSYLRSSWRPAPCPSNSAAFLM